MRSGLQDESSDEAGVDRARGAQLAVGAAFDPLQDPAGVVVRQLDGGRELDVQDPLLASDERVELPRDRGQLVRRGPSRRRAAGSCGRSRRRRPGPRAAPLCVRSCRPRGFSSSARSSGTFSIAVDELGELTPDRLELALLLGGLEQGVRVDPFGDGHDLLDLLQGGEVQLPDGVVDQPAVILVVRGPCRSPCSSRSRSGRRPRRGSARARGASRPRSASSCPRAAVAAPPRAPRFIRCALRVRRRASPRRGFSSASPRACWIIARCSSSRRAGLGAGLVRLLDRLPNPIASSVDRILNRPEDVLPQHEERDAEARRGSRSSGPGRPR